MIIQFNSLAIVCLFLILSLSRQTFDSVLLIWKKKKKNWQTEKSEVDAFPRSTLKDSPHHLKDFASLAITSFPPLRAPLLFCSFATTVCFSLAIKSIHYFHLQRAGTREHIGMFRLHWMQCFRVNISDSIWCARRLDVSPHVERPRRMSHFSESMFFPLCASCTEDNDDKAHTASIHCHAGTHTGKAFWK